jgi:DNA mismatch endonuclease (patch repair protein)
VRVEAAQHRFHSESAGNRTRPPWRYWHGCPEHGSVPRANQAWWEAKFARNSARDTETAALLADASWRVIVVWEHEDPAAAANRVEAAVTAPHTN